MDDSGKLKIPVATQPKIDGAGIALHSDIILPLHALNSLPADYKISLPESDAPNTARLQWWLLVSHLTMAGMKAFFI